MSIRQGLIQHNQTNLVENAVNFVRRVAKAFSSRSHHLIKMPTATEMEESARQMEDRFVLKDIALGVGGHLHVYI